MKIVIMDGQGGRLGKLIIERLIQKEIKEEIIAVGTNSIATASMMKAGIKNGATGENATIINSRKADLIVGPIGIVIADSLLGEVTPSMAIAIGQSDAKKILLPSPRCNNYVVGTKELSMDSIVDLAVEEIINYIGKF